MTRVPFLPERLSQMTPADNPIMARDLPLMIIAIHESELMPGAFTYVVTTRIPPNDQRLSIMLKKLVEEGVLGEKLNPETRPLVCVEDERRHDSADSSAGVDSSERVDPYETPDLVSE